MSNIAIICEYNPFHNGHKFQIETHKKKLSADGVICIMSGNFVQRGAPAVCDKWKRAEMALSGGADLVIELPAVFATQSAERFGYGAVLLADKLGVVDYLSFGCECDDLSLLKRSAKSVCDEDVKRKTAELLKSGISYPVARKEAAGEEFGKVLDEPNNILAIEYLKALSKIDSKIIPAPLKREGCAHDSEETEGEFASASYLRNCVLNEMSVTEFMPEACADILKKADVFKDKKALDSIITYLLRTKSAQELSQISDMAEGLENRFIEAAKMFSSFDEISEFVKTKRYTKTRIDRILINILLSITKEDIKKEPCYVRVLGFNEKGREILSAIKKKADIPIITKVKDAHLSPVGEQMLKKDIYATDIYSLILSNGKSGLDFTNKVRIFGFEKNSRTCAACRRRL